MKSKGGSRTLSKFITICGLGPLDRMIIEHVPGAISKPIAVCDQNLFKDGFPEICL